MTDWIKTSEQLPEKGKVVEVKADPFPNSTGYAVLVDTEWETTEFVYGGFINMATDLISEWRYADVETES